MKLYDLVRSLLERYPNLRDSDKYLIWAIWSERGYCQNRNLSFQDYMRAPVPESITRARRKVQEDHPELSSSIKIQTQKDQKESTKGMFIYHEKV